MIEDFLPFAALGFITVVIVMFAFGLKRGTRMQDTNARIEENQREAIALNIRQVAALERIAAALENRNG